MLATRFHVFFFRLAGGSLKRQGASGAASAGGRGGPCSRGNSVVVMGWLVLLVGAPRNRWRFENMFSCDVQR